MQMEWYQRLIGAPLAVASGVEPMASTPAFTAVAHPLSESDDTTLQSLLSAVHFRTSVLTRSFFHWRTKTEQQQMKHKYECAVAENYFNNRLRFLFFRAWQWEHQARAIRRYRLKLHGVILEYLEGHFSNCCAVICQPPDATSRAGAKKTDAQRTPGPLANTDTNSHNAVPYVACPRALEYLFHRWLVWYARMKCTRLVVTERRAMQLSMRRHRTEKRLLMLRPLRWWQLRQKNRRLKSHVQRQNLIIPRWNAWIRYTRTRALEHLQDRTSRTAYICLLFQKWATRAKIMRIRREAEETATVVFHRFVLPKREAEFVRQAFSMWRYRWMNVVCVQRRGDQEAKAARRAILLRRGATHLMSLPPVMRRAQLSVVPRESLIDRQSASTYTSSTLLGTAPPGNICAPAAATSSSMAASHALRRHPMPQPKPLVHFDPISAAHTAAAAHSAAAPASIELQREHEAHMAALMAHVASIMAEFQHLSNTMESDKDAVRRLRLSALSNQQHNSQLQYHRDRLQRRQVLRNELTMWETRMAALEASASPH